MISVEREHNNEIIESVLSHKEIFDCIAEDGQNTLNIDSESSCFLSLWVDEKLAGVYILDALSSIEIDIHAHILPEFRKEFGRSLTRLVWEWIIETEYQKVSAQVPVIYPNVISFCKEFGMIEEGINRLSWLKNGQIHDQVRLGITKDEINSFLEATK